MADLSNSICDREKWHDVTETHKAGQRHVQDDDNERLIETTVTQTVKVDDTPECVE